MTFVISYIYEKKLWGKIITPGLKYWEYQRGYLRWENLAEKEKSTIEEKGESRIVKKKKIL